MQRLTQKASLVGLALWAGSTLLFLSILTLPNAQAQTATALTLRAVGPHVSDELILHVALNAKPYDLTSQDLSGITPLTPNAIIRRLCGWVTDAYRSGFLKVNSLKSFDFDALIAEPGNMAWPRCLKVDLSPQKVQIREGVYASNLYKQLTGSPGRDDSVAKFFGISVESMKLHQNGQVLTGSYRTLPVTIFPKKVTPELFAKDVVRIAAAGGKLSNAMILISPLREGVIVLAMPVSDQNDISVDIPLCAGFERPPIEAEAIKQAYHLARKGWVQAPDPARIVVVDNGFFGADPTNDKGLFEGSPFPDKYFLKDKDNDQSLAQKINITNSVIEYGEPIEFSYIDPSNFVHSIDPNENSQHGTHVTGLTLGGPAFATQREQLRENGAPWAQITILNVGRGGANLFPNAQGHIQSFISVNRHKPYIVNLSIAYAGGADSDIRTLFNAILSDMHPNSLLVVAAGNEKNSVLTANLVPASLGGTSSQNVITVAAYDASGGLAPFSNYEQDIVDIAAPGCKISSWILNTLDPANNTAAMSGTSMATPLVTFAAALLRSLDAETKAGDIKSRLIASGDLLVQDPKRPIAYKGVRLNIAKSLYWSHDYVKVGEEQLLGSIQRLPNSARKCLDEAKPHNAEEVWAIKKRADGSGLLFLGKNLKRVARVCDVDAMSDDLVFTPTHRITEVGPEPLAKPGEPAPAQRTESMKNVNEIVVRNR
ncbi:S8 family serine peptidase [Dechloromonas denitrificans]|uniref:S8 family serine peptidase n=1 Tax=Dechloromonas denitrificans TaxID=281362 RepID=UPI001CFB744B|nr:S8 family serine peptidase [Dechloromonas denitrificans]UCV07024.1 S8 family serine peptidase [Dechloromonas denitrificans]